METVPEATHGGQGRHDSNGGPGPMACRSTAAGAALGLLCAVAIGMSSRPAMGGDWPRWRGPTSNGSAADCGEELIDSMADAKLVWESEDRGLPTSYWSAPGWIEASGFCNPIVAGGSVYFAYSRRDGSVISDFVYRRYLGTHDEASAKWWASLSADDVIMCLDAENGRTLWKTVFRGKGMVYDRIAANFGPLNVPCVSDGRVFVLGTMGNVYALDAVTGRPVWESDIGPGKDRIVGEFEARKALTDKAFGGHGRFLDSCVAVADGVVLANAHEFAKRDEGSQGQFCGMLGLDAATGRHLWYVRDCLRHTATSPLCWSHRGKEYAIAASAKRTVCVEPKTGAILWEITQAVHDSGTPALTEDYAVFSGHAQKRPKDGDTGINCWRITPEKATLVWGISPLNYTAGGSCSLCIHNGYVYASVTGLNGRKGGVLCIELETGKEIGIFAGGGGYSPIMAGDRFLTTDGSMYFAHPYLGRNLFGRRSGSPPGWSHSVWTTSCVSDGRLVVRGRHRLLCYDLRKRVALAAEPEAEPAEDTLAPALDAGGEKLPPWLRRSARPPATTPAVDADAARIVVAADPAAIVSHLKSRYFSDRKAALRAFSELEPAAQDGMVPALVALLREAPWPTRWAAALALETLGDRAAGIDADLRAWLLDALRAQSPGDIRLAAVLLHRCAPHAIPLLAQPLGELLVDSDADVVRHACIAVESLGPRVAAVREVLKRLPRREAPWGAAFVRRATEALDRDAAWMPLPMEGLRPTQLDYADHGNAETERVRDEQW